MSGINVLQPYYITIYGEQARKTAEILGDKKEIPESFACASRHQADIIMDVMGKTDGSYSGNKLTLISISKSNVDMLQRIFISNGYSCSVKSNGFKSGFKNGREQFKLSVYFNLSARNLGKIKVKESGPQTVFGFEMPMGTMITRHSGKVAFTGNCLVDRKGRTTGLPERCFKDFRDIWKLPKGWVDDWEFELDGVLYKHGLGYGGKRPHALAAIDAGQPCVIGHAHSILAGEFIVTNRTALFGVSVGCGIDRKLYAFRYGKDMRYKPIIGCAVIIDGETFVLERMPL
jgi:hypothetical protein